MSERPAVSVVVPFAGDPDEARATVALLDGLRTHSGDQLVLSDNSGTVPNPPARVTVVRAEGEASPSHARNVGAAAATNGWLLFLDADVRAPAELIDQFFTDPIPDRVGAVTGDIVGTSNPRTLAARYGTMRNFLGQRSHVMNQFRPRAASANLLVRRAAFEQVGGYREGIRQAEDTDFVWRLQAAGWTLQYQGSAVVEHAYRQTLKGLRRQWRGYAAGAAWLASEYPDFKIDPGIHRMLRRALKRVGIGPGVAFRADGRSSAESAALSRWERLQFLAVDCMLGIEELIGHRRSNLVAPNRRAD